MLDLFFDALWDTAKLLPFLYLTYLAMEYLEHRLAGRSRRLIERAGRLGPLWGGLLGAAPQCGFSAAAASLYAGGVITLGTLLAVFLSTSDEMLPILLSRRTPAATILKILGLKAAIGVAAGFLIDLACRRRQPTRRIGDFCAEAGCGCGGRAIPLAALRHTVGIALFLLLFSFLIGLGVHWIGAEQLARFLGRRPALSVFLAALVGLIPNCAASAALTTLYLDGLLRFGALLSGLLVGAGVGLLVLFRSNRNARENGKIVLLLYAVGVACGAIAELLS